MEEMKKRMKGCLIICSVIACVISGFICLVADAQWAEEQRAMVAQDFLEAIVTVDEEKIDLYCNEETFIHGSSFYEFRNKIIPSWKTVWVEVTEYELTGESDSVPGWYFFKIEYIDANGNVNVIEGSFTVSRKGRLFWVSMFGI